MGWMLRATGAMAGPSVDFDTSEARRALSLVADPAQCLELRALPTGQNVIRPGDDVDDLLRWASERGNQTVYWNTNPVKRGHQAPTAKKDDVACRRWLLVDIDPQKPEEHKDSSATDEEHEAARLAALEVHAYLGEKDWPAPVIIDSGNGWYLLYRIDLPNTPHAQATLKRVYYHLHEKFTVGAVIDRSVHNANRLAKLPGSMARKGPNLPLRPHRPCRFVHVPDTVQIVPAELLACLAGPEGTEPRQENVPHAFQLNGSPAGNAAYVRRAVEGEVARVALALRGPKDGLNNALNNAAFRLGTLGGAGLLSQVDAAAALVPLAISRGLGEVEATRTFQSGWEAGFAQPRQVPPPKAGGARPVFGGGTLPPSKAPSVAVPPGRYRPLPPWQPLPLEALPLIVRELVAEAAQSICCDPAMVALPALAAVASAVGLSRSVILKEGWTEPSAIWSLVVADSGSGKGPAYRAATRPLMQLQAEARRLHAETMREYEQDVARIQAMPKAERPEEPREPGAPRRRVASDATIEAVGILLEKNPRGVLVASDEMDAWFCSFTRYKGKAGGSDRPRWLTLHSADTLIVDRVGRPPLIVDSALVSLTGTIQPGVLRRALDREALDAGLAARLLLASPPKMRKHWRSEGLTKATRDRYRSLLSSLLALPWAGEEEREPDVVGLSRPAQIIWEAYYDRWADLQYEADGARAAALAKLEGYASRLALLHHLCTQIVSGAPDRHAIQPESMNAAIRLTEWFAHESDRLLAILTEEEGDRDVRGLAEWLARRGGRATARDLQRSQSHRFPSREQAETALDGLVNSGAARWEDQGTGPRGGRPVRICVLVDPRHNDTTDTTSDDAVPTEPDTTPESTPPNPTQPPA